MPSSESVWFEQVDTALINYIKGIVKIPNASGNPVSVPVKVRKPDEDFKIEEYPCITLYNLYSVRDVVRYYPERVAVSRDASTNTLVQENSAIPYSLYYQLDFWARLQSQMNDMTRLWLGYHPNRDFILPVLDVSKNPRDCSVLMDSALTKADFIDGTNRTFHSVLTLRVWVELDERVQFENSLVTAIPESVNT